jgi:hypothetical protein
MALTMFPMKIRASRAVANFAPLELSERGNQESYCPQLKYSRLSIEINCTTEYVARKASLTHGVLYASE